MSTTTVEHNRGRWPLVLLLVVFISPVLFALLWSPTGYVNRGELVEPARPVSTLPFQTLDGRQQSLAELDPKWTYVYFANDGCGRDCQVVVDELLRIRLSRGTHRDRIHIFLAIIPSAKTLVSRGHPAEHTALTTGYLKPEVLSLWQAKFTVTGGTYPPEAGRIYLLDPLGNLMMSYPSQAGPEDIRKDIARLLRASRIG